MRQLLLNKDLLAAEEGSSLRAVATAQTLSSLGQMSPEGKGIALRFLYESALVREDNPIINLNGADLSGIDLHRSNLSGGGPFLIPASGGYSGVVKPGNAANLSGAILNEANLERALLSDTDLSKAYLSGADLAFARLKGADLSKADLTKEIWESRGGTTGPHARNADMSWANLKNADLSDAKLSGANLSGANLSGANLSDANLNDASGITNEELARIIHEAEFC